jgi:hypothetical protein
MWSVSEHITIAATSEAIWSVIADIGRHAELAGSGEVLRVRTTGPVAVGMTFEGDIAVGEVGSFVSSNVIERCDVPRFLAWTSYPPLDDGETEDHQIEVRWSFRLSTTGDGTLVEHSFEVPRPKAGAEALEDFLERADRIATVRSGMLQTLANLKHAVETAG